MGLVTQITQAEKSSVLIDTAPFVYFIEEREPYVELLTSFFDAVDAGRIQALTTTITCSETLVIPCRRQNDKELITKYETFLLETPSLTIIPLNFQIAKITAEIRAQHGLKTPDAIQWATAIQCGVHFFLTNDKGFQKFSNPKVLMIDDYLPKSK